MKGVTIDDQAKISIGIVIILIGGIAGGVASYVNMKDTIAFNDQKTVVSIATLNEKISSVDTKLDILLEKRVSVVDSTN